MVVFSRLSYSLLDSLRRNLESLGLGASSYPILAHLNEVEKARTQKLGDIAVISSGSITHMVNKLEKNGFVKKFQDEEDKRIFWVVITEKGRARFNEVNQTHMQYLDSLLADFTKEEKVSFIKQMKYFGKTIEEKKGELQ